MKQRSSKYVDFVVVALFTAIIFVLAFTPIGYVNLIVIKATILHVPVIIGSIVLGPRMGAILGGMFGLTSLIINTMSPSLLSFAFSPLIPVPGTQAGSPLALLIAFVPRILVGVVPYYVFRLLKKLAKANTKLDYLSFAVSGACGALVNTALVMGLIYFLFRDAYAAAKDIPVGAVTGAVLAVIGTNGVPEAIVAAVCAAAICKPLLKLRASQKA